MQKLFCSFTVGLKSAFYGTSKFVLALYFCEPLLIIAPEKGLIKNDHHSTEIFIHSDLWEILSNNIYSIFDRNKRKAVNRMLLQYSWKFFRKIFIKAVAVRHSKWKVLKHFISFNIYDLPTYNCPRKGSDKDRPP